MNHISSTIADDDKYINNADSNGRGVVLDTAEIYAAFFRSRYRILVFIITCLAIGGIATLLMTRQYEGFASVEVRQEAEKVLGTEADREGVSSKIDVERFLDTQLDLVRSRLVTTAVAQDLGLFNSAFLVTMNADTTLSDSEILTEQENLKERVIRALSKNLKVAYTGQTRILVIRFTSPDPRLSAKIANSYAVNYIKSNLARKSDSSVYALDFLRTQLAEAQARLERSEREALEYARRTRIVDASNAAKVGDGTAGQPQSLVTAQLVQLNQAYSNAVAARVAAEQKWRKTMATPVLSTPEVLTNPAVQGLLERRALVEAEYKEQLVLRQSDYPTVKQAAARLAEIERQLQALGRNIRASLQNQYQIARQQETQLRGQLDDLKGQTLVEQNQTIQLSILRRAAETNRSQYEALLRRYNQLNAESGVQANNLAIVDRAVTPTKPSSPNILLNMLLALVGGVAVSVAYLFVEVQFFDRLRTEGDITSRLALPFLGAVPYTEDPIADLNDQKSATSEAFNLIRTAIAISSRGGAPATAMITSTQASEGKTSTCLAIAIAFARLGKSVIVIDVDLRRPNIHRALELPNKVGVTNILTGEPFREEIVHATQYAGLSVMTAGPLPPNPTDLILGERLSSLLEDMAARYDLVLVDAPPLLALADAEVLSGTVDATIFVIEAGRNSSKNAKRAIDRLVRGGGNVIGAVLTKYNSTEQGYGYDYNYQYQYSEREH